ncbi:MAG: hypothetical protein VB035_05475 [Candidatus Fimivivens sp.]|nr:hypothetical protein [Candidatus Fimivivens sp.]
MRKRTVTIHWSYPTMLENIYEHNIIENIGIYCIYRKFGNKMSLLYIGKTSYSFKSRIYAHEKQWLYELRGQFYIRFGKIQSPIQVNDALLEDVESALIYGVQPPYNEKKRNYYTNRTDYYVNIYNKGFRGDLPQIINAREQEKFKSK